MAKAKQTPVEQKLITLTKEQYEVLLEVRELLDTISDELNNIEGDENAFSIGKVIGSAYSDTITAYNLLSDVIVDKFEETFELDEEDEN